MYQDIYLMMPELIPVFGLMLSLGLLVVSILRRSPVPLAWATAILLLIAAYVLKRTQTGVSVFFNNDLINTALISLFAGIVFCLLLLLFPRFKRPLHAFHLLALLLVLFSCDVCIKVASNSFSERKSESPLIIGQVSTISLQVSPK